MLARRTASLGSLGSKLNSTAMPQGRSKRSRNGLNRSRNLVLGGTIGASGRRLSDFCSCCRVGWIPVRALLQTTSTEAVVNARLISLRAPIEGQVEPAEHREHRHVACPWPGRPAHCQHACGARSARRSAPARRPARERARGIAQRIVELTVLRDDLANHVRIFQDGRLRQLTERAAEIKKRARRCPHQPRHGRQGTRAHSTDGFLSQRHRSDPREIYEGCPRDGR